MYILICDDNSQEREIFTNLINDYFSDKSFNYDINCYKNGKSLLYDIEDGKQADVIFLDVYMDEILGIDVARILRDMGYKGEIVFITGTADFAIDGYDVGATGYLLKPCSYSKLCTVMDRIMQNFDLDLYSIRQRNSVVRLKLNSILYVESVNSKCILHSDTGENYVIYKRLNEIQNELNDDRFLRCHQSYLVNMNHIQQADKNFILNNGDTVSIRQRELKNIKELYFDYIKER